MTVTDYHERTCHHLDRFARSPGSLDFATMPAPFLEYAGAPLVELPRERHGTRPGFPLDAVYEPGLAAPAPIDAASIGSFLRHAFGLSAWKQAGGHRWALRVNPSSGNLHPTEVYVVAGPTEGLDARPGVHHYRADAHALETRCHLPLDAWRDGLGELTDLAFLVGFTSIPWREAWKYGERAYRYCQHDLGHALAAASVSAAMLGWDFALVPGWADEEVAALLGIDRPARGAEREEAECLALVTAAGRGAARRLALPRHVAAAAREAAWSGQPNQLSPGHVAWPILEEVAAASALPPGAGSPAPGTWPPGRPPAVARPADAREIVLARRSAQRFDGEYTLPLDDFARILDRVLPQASAPWQALDWPPAIHLVLFVHRVAGLAPGLYALPRAPGAAAALRDATRGEFEWREVPALAGRVPLFALLEGDARALAAQISCGQDIAGDGCFSLGMVAAFDEAIAAHGPWFYRRLFWEAGLVGQVLYLEAEAAGVRGTGIGCYFDSAMHDLLGFETSAWRSMYHFTVGMPVEDPRLQTRPGYEWE